MEEPTEEELKKEKDKKEGAKRSMAKLNQNPETNEEVLAFEQYMKSKGAKRDNVKSDDVGVTIPEDIKYIPEDSPRLIRIGTKNFSINCKWEIPDLKTC